MHCLDSIFWERQTFTFFTKNPWQRGVISFEGLMTVFVYWYVSNQGFYMVSSISILQIQLFSMYVKLNVIWVPSESILLIVNYWNLRFHKIFLPFPLQSPAATIFLTRCSRTEMLSCGSAMAGILSNLLTIIKHFSNNRLKCISCGGG